MVEPTLTKAEVLAKLEAYKASEADVDVKEQAISKLLAEYSFYFSAEMAMQQFEDAMPDYSDIK